MSARRPVLVALGLLCVLVCVLTVGTADAGAETMFGEFTDIGGVAVNQASGDVYVTDQVEGVVKKFDAAGGLLSEWGSVGTGAGQFGAVSGNAGPAAVAVDNELGSVSYGDVYVVDGGNSRVEKFDSEGKFLLMFGGGVNEKTAGNVCVVGEACTNGTEGSADGQFEWSFEGKYIAVGPNGRVYVGDKARVQVFEPSGAWRENISLAGLSATGKVEQLAVDASGDMFVKDSEAAGVREFEPSGNEMAAQFDAGSTTVTGLAVDGSGNLSVGDSSGGFHLLKYDPAGKELESYASNTLKGNTGLAFAETTGDLYVLGYIEVSAGKAANGQEYRVWIITPPPTGPLVEPGSVSAVPGLRGHASFHATVNPEGQETSYRYEYVDQAQFEANGYASAASTPEASIGSSFEDQSAEASVEGLTPGATYHYRIVASNPLTATSPDQSFEETPPALIDGPWAQDVASTSATLSAGIDPLGANTAYRLEWGTNTSYVHTSSGSVGEGTNSVPISYLLRELAPATTYHYRVVTVNEVGTSEGADHTFTTQPAGEERTLPDGRAWELVSPPDKKGAVIEPFNTFSDVIQAADNGDAIAYPTEGPHVGENPQSRSVESTVLSRRGPGGWTSTDIDMPRRNVNEGESAFGLILGTAGEFAMFSPDLSSAVAEPTADATPPLAAEATERTLYIRNNDNGSYLPLVTPADVPSDTKFGGEESVLFPKGNLTMRFIAATTDLSHIVFESPLALTPEATFLGGVVVSCPPTMCGAQNLYEWSAGHLQEVNILPNGKSTNAEPELSGYHAFQLGAAIAGEGPDGFGMAAHPVSADGRWVVWTWGTQFDETAQSFRGLYVRDMIAGKTMQVGGNKANYQMMTSDGSRIFYLENGDLYEFDTATATSTDLTAKHGSEENAGVQESVSDVAEDGSDVYFVATGVLAKGGVSGADNLYLLHDTGNEWTTTYIATLSPDDEKDWYDKDIKVDPTVLAGITSRVSPDGRYLAFMSDRSLTGYDNLDVNSGQPDEEVYLYDSATDRLACASCDPTGARPAGVLDENSKRLLVDNNEYWGSRTEAKSHWLAASIPGWGYRGNYQGIYQPRYLSNSGRLFFNSPDALAPQDTNGVEDVYEYEPPPGPGAVASDNCTTSSPTYSARSEGCIGLISSGASSSESVFYDASESGDDVFFITASRLTAADYDNTYDVYDAHVCSVAAPCAAEPVSAPPCTSGDSCKAAPSPQPEIFGAAPSATFSGIGNVAEEAKKTVVKAKAKAKHKKRVKHKKRKGKKAKKVRTGRTGKKGGKR
jgi:hypothetical protein